MTVYPPDFSVHLHPQSAADDPETMAALGPVIEAAAKWLYRRAIIQILQEQIRARGKTQ